MTTDSDFEAFQAELAREFRPGAVKRLEAAYHEAGHAVTAVLCDVPFVRLRLIPNETSRGSCEVLLDPPSEKTIMTLFGGQVAQTKFGNLGEHPVGNLGWGDDNQRIDSHINHLVRGRNEKQLREQLKQATEQLLLDNWTFVEAVATEALAREVLPQDIVRIRQRLFKGN
jgi:hypothetical protein